ncbi:hypothetical protein HOY82DRAFT_76490 [Tuber indicum]|nr:hypothetical protein HOY82DRAFT_76490 [Tuber indicum]
MAHTLPYSNPLDSTNVALSITSSNSTTTTTSPRPLLRLFSCAPPVFSSAHAATAATRVDCPPRHDEVVHGMCERSNDSYRSLTFGTGASGLNQCPAVLGYYLWPIRGIACARTKLESGQQIFLHQSAYRMEKLSNNAVHFKMAIISFSSIYGLFFFFSTGVSYGGGEGGGVDEVWFFLFSFLLF